MIEFLVGRVTEIISAISYLGIFVLMALESTAIPLPSELVMPFAGFLVAGGFMSFALALIAGTLGCLAGSLFSYCIGYYGGHPFIRKFGKYFLLNEKHLKKAHEWFARKGRITIFIGRFIPGIRHVISIPAGIGKMSLLSFSFFTLLGAGIWNTILLIFGYILEKNWEIVYRYSSYVDIFVIAIVAILAINYVRMLIKAKSKIK